MLQISSEINHRNWTKGCVAMELSQNSKLVQNLLHKNKLLRNGDKKHEEIRTALLILGGTQLGVYGSGTTIALHLLGLADVFDIVVGVSVGAGIGGYYLGGERQMLLGASIYYTEFSGTRFINYGRIKKIVDVSLISEVMRRGRTKMDMEAITKSRSRFFVGVTNAETGNGELIDAKSATPDIIAAIEASSVMPLGYNQPVTVNEKFYYDGSLALPFPIKDVCEKFQPTDVLVLPNSPLRFGSQLYQEITDRLFNAVAFRGSPTFLRTAFMSRHKRFHEGIDYISDHDCNGTNIGVLWPPEMGIHQLTRNSLKLRSAVQASIEKTLKVFGQPEKKFDLL